MKKGYGAVLFIGVFVGLFFLLINSVINGVTESVDNVGLGFRTDLHEAIEGKKTDIEKPAEFYSHTITAAGEEANKWENGFVKFISFILFIFVVIGAFLLFGTSSSRKPTKSYRRY